MMYKLNITSILNIYTSLSGAYYVKYINQKLFLRPRDTLASDGQRGKICRYIL